MAGAIGEYNQGMLDKAREYLDRHCNDKEVADESGQKTKLVVSLPSIEGLCLHLKIARSTCYLWKDKHKEFGYIIEELMQKQAFVLLNNGLSGTYNSTIAKVILTKHGYVDKVETDNTTRAKVELSDAGTLLLDEINN